MASAERDDARRRGAAPPPRPTPPSLPPLLFPSFEKFVVPDGVKKIAHARDTRVEHAATFTVQREDHTIGNLVRCALHRDGEVTFAGYKIPHPLEYQMLIKVATRGRRTPKEALSRALGDVADAVGDVAASFEGEVARVAGGGGGGVGGGGAGGY